MYEELLKELIREKGGTREQYLKLLDYISFHETGGTMDPTTIQRSDNASGIGPGRGKYQIEGPDGSNRLLTAANRTANYYKKLGKPVPEEIKRIQSGEIYDATQLHPELQDTLVLGDLRMKGGLDLKDYISGKLSPEDLWVNHWWSGSRDQRPTQREKFVKDMKRYDDSLQNPQSQQQEFSLFNSEPQVPTKLDFIPNLFKYGGVIKQNQLKLGGNLTNPNTMNKINMFNEGGTHESNPLGGIPQGVGQNGQMNTVEEGEGRMGDMIYSDRIPLTEEAIMAVGLPKKFVGKTPAQALAEIEKTFKDRGDRSAQETKKDFADKIAQAQEMIKQQQAEIDQAMAVNAQEVPDMMGGQIPQGMEEFVQPEQMMGGLPMEQDGRLQTGMQEQPQMFRRGGKINRYFEGGDINKPDIDYMAAATGLLGVGQNIFGRAETDASGQSYINRPEAVGGVAAKGALSGAAAGASFGALGAGIGAVVGGIGGLFKGGKEKKAAQEGMRNYSLVQRNKNFSDFAYGGKLNKYPDGGGLNDPRNKSYYPEIDSPTTPSGPMSSPLITPSMNIKGYYSTPDGKTHGKNPNSLINPENLKKAGRIGNSLLRGAPFAMNALQLRKAGQYDKVTPMLNQTRFQPKYIDERAMQNLADSEMNNQVRGISQLGGSQGAVRSSMLGAGLNRAKALGAGMVQVQAQNNQTDMYGQQFDNQITEANLARRIGAEDRTAMNKGQAATNKSRLLSQRGTDLGNVGKENMYKEIAKITGYTWLGDFIKRNPNATEEELIAEAKKHVVQEQPTTNVGAYGGKLKLKRY